MDKNKTSDNVPYIIRNNNQRISVYSIPELNFSLNIENFPMFATIFSLEINRLRTFVNYPIDGISPSLLARDGFMYLGNGYEVLCIFCRLKNSQWSTGDDVHEIHSSLSHQCPMITGIDLLNVSLHNYGTDSEIINNVQYRNEDVDQTQQPTEEAFTREIVIPETDIGHLSATNAPQLQGTYDVGLSTIPTLNEFQSEIIDERNNAAIVSQNIMPARVDNPHQVTPETLSLETTSPETDVNNQPTSAPNFIIIHRTNENSVAITPISTLLQNEVQGENDTIVDDENVMPVLENTYQPEETLAHETVIPTTDVDNLVASTHNCSNVQGSDDASTTPIPTSIVSQASKDSVVELNFRQKCSIYNRDEVNMSCYNEETLVEQLDDTVESNRDVLIDDMEFQSVETQTYETISEPPAELLNSNVHCRQNSVISVEIPLNRSDLTYSVDECHEISIEYSKSEEKARMQINISCTKKCASCNNQNSTSNETSKKKPGKLLSQDLDDNAASEIFRPKRLQVLPSG
ncbi:hypothetical protein Btru_042162 [Bulinus truncatus]|nr:hypothetical protein Btru_042162 [Bulinus truncatus]